MAKITGSRFMVTMAARAGQELDYMGSNFWFMVMDQTHQDQKALYCFEEVHPPPQKPIEWSITDPPIITTVRPLSVAEWGGKFIFWERQWDGRFRTEMWIYPDALAGGLIRFGIHAHVNPPQRGYAGLQFSGTFELHEVSPTVEVPAGTPILTGPSVLAFAPRMVTYARA